MDTVFFVDVVFDTRMTAMTLADKILELNGRIPAYVTALYCYRFTEELKPGDAVVVDTPSEGYKVAHVVRCAVANSEHGAKVFEATVERMGARTAPAGENLKWIVCKVDDAAYVKRRDDRLRAEQIKRMLDKRAKDLADLRKYDMLASDPESAAMIAELRALSGLPDGLKALAPEPAAED